MLSLFLWGPLRLTLRSSFAAMECNQIHLLKYCTLLLSGTCTLLEHLHVLFFRLYTCTQLHLGGKYWVFIFINIILYLYHCYLFDNLIYFTDCMLDHSQSSTFSFFYQHISINIFTIIWKMLNIRTDNQPGQESVNPLVYTWKYFV